ncbi:hypothetical protein QUB75_10045 [Microcoleus sp. K1-B6]|uniref:hypothetical protein n=1 Tax=unclassified Microcoleus TaxID=2642155 RepID=UPI002FD1EBDC
MQFKCGLAYGKKLDRLLGIDIKCTGWQKSPPAGGISEIIKKNIYPLDIYTK